MTERRGMKALELWCRRVTDGYPGVKIDNMTTSWRDGLAFCALIHHFRPDLIDFDRLDKRDILKNNELAFRVAERQLGIPALLDAEDMLEYEIPDRLSILTYLSQFYQAFAHQGGNSPTASKHNSSVQEMLDSSSTGSAVKVGRGRVERCSACDRPVFLAERLVIGSKLRHRSCFVCARCGHQLNAVTCYETETGDFVCDMCPDEDAKRAVEPTVSTIETSHAEDAPVPGHNAELVVDIKKPSDPSKLKFLSDILDGDKTDLSFTNVEEEDKEEDRNAPLGVDEAEIVEKIEGDLKIGPDCEIVENLENEPHSEIVKNSEIEPHSEIVENLEIEPNSEIVQNSAGISKIAPEEAAGNSEIDPTSEIAQHLTENLKIELDSEVADSVTENLKPEPDENSEDLTTKPETPSEADPESLKIEPDKTPDVCLELEDSANGAETTIDSSIDTQITVTDVEESPVAKNPFDESDDEEANAIPVPLARTCRKVSLNDEGKTIIEAPKYLNPFWSESDLSDGEESPQRPVPAPRLLRTPEPIPRSRFGSSTSLASSSSAGKKKKRPAPQPPATPASPTPSRRRKSRPAPPPPINFDKERKDYENKVKQNLSPPDKSTYGKWKRKKGLAPGLPIPPQRRRIIPLPVGDVGQQVEDLEIQQRELERQGVKLEQNIRNIEEGGDEQQSDKDIEEMVLQLFEIVNQKNELFRKQAELMFLRKQQRLEEEHADIEYQIRCLMGRPKNEADPVLEEELIRRLVDVVERRNEIIDCLDMNRKRAVEEDQSIQDRLQAYSNRDLMENDESEPAAPSKKRLPKSVLKLIKKKKEKKKEKDESDKRKDLDVDIDESITEDVSPKSSTLRIKKKWFKLDK